jgi:hypothetical protein
VKVRLKHAALIVAALLAAFLVGWLARFGSVRP